MNKNTILTMLCKYDIIIHIFVILFLHLIDVQLNYKIIILEEN